VYNGRQIPTRKHCTKDGIRRNKKVGAQTKENQPASEIYFSTEKILYRSSIVNINSYRFDLKSHTTHIRAQGQQASEICYLDGSPAHPHAKGQQAFGAISFIYVCMHFNKVT
jgi:hypothetical protein